jgi:hypothetical protein
MKHNLIRILVLVALAVSTRGWCADGQKAAPKEAVRPARKLVQVATSAKPAEVNGKEFDLVVAQGTPGGIAMAVRAAREGARVLLVNHDRHLGGLLSSGLGIWDSLWEGKRSPIYDEARQAILDYYRTTYGPGSPQYRAAKPGSSGHSNGNFEPHVAELILTALVTCETNITVLLGYYPATATREGAILKSVGFRELNGSGSVQVIAKIFADCSYEGDLAAVAKVPYRVGREARAEYNEPHAGVVFMKLEKQPTNPEQARSAKLQEGMKLRKFPGFQSVYEPESTGEADGNVQAFNYRTPFSADPTNCVPVEKPANYDPALLAKLDYNSMGMFPNKKRWWNRPQLIGSQTAYVEGDWATRQKVMDQSWEATLGLLYYLQNESANPGLRRDWGGYGLCKDEFADNGHRPYVFYIREARRITGRAVFTEHDATLMPDLDRAPVHADSIAITEWYLDSHACTPARLHIAPLPILQEGKMMLQAETFPGQLSYRTLLPQGLDNLLVPVCLSATHVAWGTVRLEPTWMNIAESAAYAAVQALQNNQTPAVIDTDRLLRTLAQKHCMISFFNDVDVAANDAWIPAAQYFGTKGFFHNYNARAIEPLSEAVREVWQDGFKQLQAGKLEPNKQVAAVHAAEAKADSPSTGELRADFLLKLWNQLSQP